MRPVCTIPIVGIMILTSLSFSISGSKPEKKETIAEAGFAVVELFTSEGCSSCPPADELAIELSKEYKSKVYFLGYHVDYWNHIGWKDKFSKAEYTHRQWQYARVFNLNSIYTPQVVVNGKKELLGSDKGLLRKTITDELKIKSDAEIQLSAKHIEKDISVFYKTSVSDKYILQIALVQLYAETPVKRGENKGRYLKHTNVIRDIQSIGINKKGEGQLQFKIPDGLTATEIKLVAFIQHINELTITGAAESDIK